MIEHEYFLNSFHKAIDMLRSDNPLSQRGGLYILHDMVTGAFNDTYIPCVDVLADWLRGEDNSSELIKMAVIIFRQAMEAIPPERIEKHKRKYSLLLWPNLQDVNLEGINLKNMDLQQANMHGANLQGAFVSGANMENTQGLTQEQVLQTTWIAHKSGGMDMPRLPRELQYADKVQEWLIEPPFLYDVTKQEPYYYRHQTV